MLAFISLFVQLLSYAGYLVFVGVPNTAVEVLLVFTALMASYLWQRYLASGFARKAVITEQSRKDARGRVAVITGGNTGIGFEVARELLRLRVSVILGCRDSGRAAEAVKRLRRLAPGAKVFHAPLDLSRQRSVRGFVTLLPSLLGKDSLDEVAIDFLVNNAGVYTWARSTTEDGLESVTAVNHVSPFLLTELLLPCLKRGLAGRGARVVNMASVAHHDVAPLDLADSPSAVAKCLERSATDFGSRYYGLSKLCNVMHAEYLAREHGLLATSVHPGGVLTEMFRHVPVERLLFSINRLALKTPLEGAQTVLQCLCGPPSDPKRDATVPNGSHWIIRGGYYADCCLAEQCRHPVSVDPVELRNFVAWSKEAAGLQPPTV